MGRANSADDTPRSDGKLPHLSWKRTCRSSGSWKSFRYSGCFPIIPGKFSHYTGKTIAKNLLK